MKLRKERGGTLALVAAATITLILLGICFFFLAQIFGGEREIQHATDSGNLNVAKNALRSPSVKLTGTAADLYGQFGDRSLINNAAPPAQAPVNLLTYDRCYAAALLACLNASTDPGPANKGATDANTMVSTLQSGSSSVGGQLSAALSSTDPSQNPLLQNFTDTGSQNSLRMLGSSSTLNRVDQAFAVSYLEQTNSDIGATNISVPGSLTGLFSASLQTAFFTQKGGTTYLRGYVEPGISSVSFAPVGVPMQPGDQPHLVSNKTFANQINRGASFANAAVPPNGFRSTSTALEEKSSQNASTVACAEVGSLNLSYALSNPYGYIMIQNGPDSSSGDSVGGPFAGLDHVLNNELLNPGITISGQVFSDDKSSLDAWAKYNYNNSKGITPNPQPPLSSLHNLQGGPATLADATTVPYVMDPSTNSPIATGTLCTDDNSTGWSRSDPDVVGQCWDELGNGTGPGAFDAAYHPNANYQNPGPPSGGLMATECAKCQLQHKFNTCGSLTVDNSNCGTTGLRVLGGSGMLGGYSFDGFNGEELPSASMGQCQISQDSTVQALGNFVQAGWGDQLVTLISTRANQINPTNGAAQAKALLAAHTLKLGETAYIYAPNPDAPLPDTNGLRNLTWTDTAPPWAIANASPDQTPVGPGSTNTPAHTYNIVSQGGTGSVGIVNPHHDGDIHDQMYRDHPDSGITASDTAVWTPSTGFQNLLGKVQFTDSASGTASGFCKPD